MKIPVDPAKLKTNLSFDSLNMRMKKIQYRLHLAKKKVLPIRWNSFANPQLIFKSALDTTPTLKVFIATSLLGVFTSLWFLGYGLYLEFTIPAFAQGGEVREAIIESDFTIFNPVLSSSTEAESRVNSLLYHPLYKVEYPDFLAESGGTPKITPILLDSEPTWKPGEEFRTLKFKLKKDIKWSNGEPITSKDVEYTYNLLKPSKDSQGGNLQFRDILSQTSFQIINEKEFEIISQVANPQLIFNANFTPISRSYFSDLNLERLASEPRSNKPLVTSGYFTFTSNKVQDPDNPRGQMLENPVKDSASGSTKLVVLEKNPFQNTSDSPFIDKYIFRKYPVFAEGGSNSTESMSRAIREGKIDLFSRFSSPLSSIKSETLKNTKNIEYASFSTNTFYNLYLNIKINDYFINQSMRKYVVCSFMKLKLGEKYESAISDVPPNKRLLPLHIKESFAPDCPEDTDSILDKKFYRVVNENGKKQIFLLANPVTIQLAGIDSTGPLLGEIESYFESIGIDVTETIADPGKLAETLKTKSYSALFFPVTHISNDLYSLYGANSQNVSNIQQNNKVLSYDVENNLKKYSASNNSDNDAKNKLSEFFKNEYVSLNLFRGKSDILYSKKLDKNSITDKSGILTSSLPRVLTFPTDAGLNYSELSFKTKRIRK
jgi:ABC-type transport system substrate-binding protein